MSHILNKLHPTLKSTIEVRYEDETLWLSEKMMSALFDVTTNTTSEHLEIKFPTCCRNTQGILIGNNDFCY